MSARILFIASALMAASCATAQENPNYQHSSKYGQTQMAGTTYSAPISTQLQPLTASTEYSSGQTHTADSNLHTGGYVGNEGTLVPAAHPAPVTNSPTERAYDTNRMQGTPGYEMMRAQQETTNTHPSYPAAPAPVQTYQPAPAPTYTPYVAPMPAPQTAPAPRRPQPVPYDYGQNMIVTENAPARPRAPGYDQSYDRGYAGTAANVATGQSYVVRQGDTVYSLARRLCTPMAELMAPNAIGGDYAISIGQTLYLPQSRCR